MESNEERIAIVFYIIFAIFFISGLALYMKYESALVHPIVLTVVSLAAILGYRIYAKRKDMESEKDPLEETLENPDKKVQGAPQQDAPFPSPQHKISHTDKQATVSTATVTASLQNHESNITGMKTKGAGKSFVIISSFVLAALVFIPSYIIDADFRSAVLFAYGIWAWYWGLILMWPAYRSHQQQYGGMMRLSETIFVFPIYTAKSLGIGFVGGGIYQFIKFLRSSR